MVCKSFCHRIKKKWGDSVKEDIPWGAAVNALLFLCRNVLMVELGDLGTTVRARRGRMAGKPVASMPADWIVLAYLSIWSGGNISVYFRYLSNSFLAGSIISSTSSSHR